MKQNVQTALDNVQITYNELIDFANDSFQSIVLESKQVVDNIRNNINNMSTDDLRSTMLDLAIKSFSISEIKEKATFKAELSEAMRKEAYSRAFAVAQGTVAVKDGEAIQNTSSEILAEEVYTLVSNMMKTHCDELHRIVDVCKTIIMSRASEAKLIQQ